MANVNLISARRAERVRLTRVARGLMGVIVAGAALGVGANTFVFTRNVMAHNEIAKRNEELKKLEPTLIAIRNAQQERIAIAPRLDTLTDAQKKTQKWFDVLEGLKKAVPEQTWLTSFSVEGGADNPAVRLVGVTSNQARVGETMMRLNSQAEYYDRVDLRYTQAIANEEEPRVEFEVLAHLNIPQPPKPEEKGTADAAKGK